MLIQVETSGPSYETKFLSGFIGLHNKICAAVPMGSNGTVDSVSCVLHTSNYNNANQSLLNMLLKTF